MNLYLLTINRDLPVFGAWDPHHICAVSTADAIEAGTRLADSDVEVTGVEIRQITNFIWNE